jgi:hypothetical protein
MTAILATLRDRVELALQDASNAIWSTDDIDEAIRLALGAYTKVNPHRRIDTITLTADGREIDISGLTALLRVERVWWDYDAADPRHPPRWRDFEVWPGDILYINDAGEPQSGDVVRVWHTTPQTLAGLDAVPDLPLLDSFNRANGGVGANWTNVANALLVNSNECTGDAAALCSAWWDIATFGPNCAVSVEIATVPGAGDLAGVALRWDPVLLNGYELVYTPAGGVDAVVLNRVDLGVATEIGAVDQEVAAGDILMLCAVDSTISAYLYTSNAWSEIVAATDTAYTDAGYLQLAVTDTTVRVDDFSGATVPASAIPGQTTLPDDDESLIALGAAAYAAQSRSVETTERLNIDGWVSKRLRLWSEGKMKEFEAGLGKLAAQIASRESGIAAGPYLDRWDGDGTGWW